MIGSGLPRWLRAIPNGASRSAQLQRELASVMVVVLGAEVVESSTFMVGLKQGSQSVGKSMVSARLGAVSAASLRCSASTVRSSRATTAQGGEDLAARRSPVVDHVERAAARVQCGGEPPAVSETTEGVDQGHEVVETMT